MPLVHISAVTLSFSGFLARGIGALRGAAWVRHRATRVLPWLRAKIAGLVCYILLGAIALRPRIGRAV